MKIGDLIYIAECKIQRNELNRAFTTLNDAEQIASCPHHFQMIGALKMTIERKKNDIIHKRNLWIESNK